MPYRKNEPPKLVLGDADSELAYARYMETMLANELAKVAAPILEQHLSAAVQAALPKAAGASVNIRESYTRTTRMGRDLVMITGNVESTDGYVTPFTFGVSVRPAYRKGEEG